MFLSDPWQLNGIAYVVKIIPSEDEMELEVYAKAANDRSLSKHILQYNVIRTENHPPLLVLPYVHKPYLNFFTFTDFFYQVLKVTPVCTPHTTSNLRTGFIREWKLSTIVT